MLDDEKWKPVQLFLSEEGVHDVEVNTEDTLDVRCNCPKFLRIHKCVHAKYIYQKMKESGGHYEILVDPDNLPSEEIALEAMESTKAFRAFLVRYADILEL